MLDNFIQQQIAPHIPCMRVFAGQTQGRFVNYCTNKSFESAALQRQQNVKIAERSRKEGKII